MAEAAGDRDVPGQYVFAREVKVCHPMHESIRSSEEGWHIVASEPGDALCIAVRPCRGRSEGLIHMSTAYDKGKTHLVVLMLLTC